jgi:hypothetical protein
MKTIMKVFKIGATILFYTLILFSLFITCRFINKLIKDDRNNYITINDGNMESIFKNLDKQDVAKFTYSPNNGARYKPRDLTYSIDVKPNTSTGIYYMASTLVFMIFGVLILWTFKKIFTEISIDQPFKSRVVKDLQLLGFLFILSEILGFIHYFILGKLINSSLSIHGLHQVSQKGSSLLIGFIILVIAIVYKRGLEISEENSLTV